MIALHELVEFLMTIKHVAKATTSNAFYGHREHFLHYGNRLIRTVVKQPTLCLLRGRERERERERKERGTAFAVGLVW